MNTQPNMNRYLIASDFDQTLSFNDSGQILGDMMGIADFDIKVRGLASSHLVNQGAELAYLLRHDPAFRNVRREHLVEAGRRVPLKDDVALLAELLEQGIDGVSFEFVVISAGPRLVVQSALEGLIPPENIHGTEFDFDPKTGEICAVRRVPAGHGKVAVLQEIERELGISPAHTIYIGDGSSDLYVMHHVNSREGRTIAVSESKDIGRIAQRTVLSDNATSVLALVLEDVLRWDSLRIREYFEAHGLAVQGWDKIRTDWLTLQRATAPQLSVIAG